MFCFWGGGRHNILYYSSYLLIDMFQGGGPLLDYIKASVRGKSYHIRENHDWAEAGALTGACFS